MDMEAVKQMAEQQAKAEESQKAAEKNRRLNLTAMLTPEARERLDRLAIVNKTRAEAVGDHIVSLAENGFIAQRVTDEQMKRYMDEIASAQSGKVQIQRKKAFDDSDDDNDDDL